MANMWDPSGGGYGTFQGPGGFGGASGNYAGGASPTHSLDPYQQMGLVQGAMQTSPLQGAMQTSPLPNPGTYANYGGFDNLGAAQNQFYNDGGQGSQAAYQQITNWLNPGTNTYMNYFLQSQYGRLYNNYLNQDFALKDPTSFSWTDFLKNQGQGLYNRYLMQTPQQRGLNPGLWGAGRTSF